jgi:hypothetical protein
VIIVRIMGGLGNQMFQYAAAKALATRLKTVLKLDITSFETDTLRSFELDLFDEHYVIATEKEIECFMPKKRSLWQCVLFWSLRKEHVRSGVYCKQRSPRFDQTVYVRTGDTYLDGYWQSERYFLDAEASIRKSFSFGRALSPGNVKIQQQILSCESVSIHVRRGDYVTNTLTNSIHGTCSLAYYEKAVEEIAARVPNLHLFVFSDDVVWTKENLNFAYPITFIERNEESADWEEMYLMSQCCHNIIANSSFSWWGAWLNSRPDRMVIAPEKWFNDQNRDTSDLIPETWIRL